jgi:mannose-6-phosphate isomerase-like protein (cupin superfamily)
MTPFETKSLPAAPDAVAPDGSNVRILLRLEGGSMAHFELPAGRTSRPVAHRTVEEFWLFLSGRGVVWRSLDGQPDSIVAVESGVSVTIPVGTRFQFRSFGDAPLCAVGVTMPPWPGDDEAMLVRGRWDATVR